ncbi:hypothetical protein OG730_00545 [Streptomyces sp. NBC_01298]|nr:hypothetical protein OG730_00545 [Streptomyces sp. NBC_01298]
MDHASDTGLRRHRGLTPAGVGLVLLKAPDRTAVPIGGQAPVHP